MPARPIRVLSLQSWVLSENSGKTLSNMKVFVAAPLTENLDNGFLEWIESLLKEAGLHPLIPHHYAGKLKSLDDEIKFDFSLVDSSDILLAEVTKPSHGVGMEILYAHQKGKKIIFMKRSGVRLSGMVHVHGKTIEYDTLEDLKEKLMVELKT